MKSLISLHNATILWLDRADFLLPTLARFLFAAVLLFYFWSSGLTKVGEGPLGLFQPSSGAYVQIFPRVFEAAGYDSSQLSLLQWSVVVAGTLAEFILPILIVIGLFSRLAALGMIGFVVLQSATDIVGHQADATTVGTWFDRIESSAIMDQRALWVFVLIVIAIKGAGPLSIDRLLAKRAASKM